MLNIVNLKKKILTKIYIKNFNQRTLSYIFIKNNILSSKKKLNNYVLLRNFFFEFALLKKILYRGYYLILKLIKSNNIIIFK